ncbi:hypothetical protein HYH03_004478 [Edaphochlamys debaryana]|uniref:phytol kinase n=1 Tax=Edaphochlamys debaryana TaxID=47281 RepID=A0A835Y7L3_9CHLO|nr:hypothetical protein HYH03_004478 [Edaphochlamys debaryana]|eukprot:KAG2497745.1 hypothetical protein HYH03_004478 [Edaphochlamys debaryana]
MSELGRDLGIVKEYALGAPQNAVALLEADTDGQFACALVALVSFATRKEVTATPGKVEEDRHSVAYQALQLTSIVLQPATSGSPSAAASVRPFAATLLKVQTLHAAARQVAAVCALLAPEAGGGHGGTDLCMRAGDLAYLQLRLLANITQVAQSLQDSALAGSLLAALEESSLLGHASRLLLLMRPPPGAPPPEQLIMKQAELFLWLTVAVNQLGVLVSTDGGPGLVEKASYQAAVGPCCSRALLLLCGSVLAAADGQPCGLPQDWLLSPPITVDASYFCLESTLLFTCLVQFSLDAARPAPSLSPRAILRLALRALVLAGASARAGAGAVSLDSRRQPVVDLSWAGGRRRGTQAFRVLLTPGEVGSVGQQALLSLVAAARRWPRAWKAEAARAWAPVLTSALHCQAAAEAGQKIWWIRTTFEVLCCAVGRLRGEEGSPPALVFHPAHLPPSVAAALEGGVVPLLETMLRCAAASPAGPEAPLVGRFSAARGGSFAALLAHSPPRQAASLLRTLAKLLRTLPPDVLLRPMHSRAVVQLPEIVILTARNIVEWALPVCCRASEPAAGPVDPAAPCAPVCVLALAVLQLLPELSRLTLGAVKLWQTRLSGASGQRAEETLLDVSVSVVLPAVYQACCYVEPAAEDAFPHRLASALCLPLLVEECGAVPLLGALLEASLGEAGQASWMQPPRIDLLVGSCLEAYRHYPHLVLGRGSGADGAGGSTAPGAAAAWSPEALRLLATRVSEALPVERQHLEDLADRLDQPGSDQTLARQPRDAAALAAAAQRLAALRAEAAALLPACANPACASLEGDSEADVRLQQCGRCRRVSYCCRECQTAHWKAGHKAECEVDSS